MPQALRGTRQFLQDIDCGDKTVLCVRGHRSFNVWGFSDFIFLLPACKLSCFSCVQLCDPMACSLPGSSVPGIIQAVILEWVAMPSSRESSQPRDRICICCIAGRFFFFFLLLSHKGRPIFLQPITISELPMWLCVSSPLLLTSKSRMGKIYAEPPEKGAQTGHSP